MWTRGRERVNNPLMPWFDAIDQPGAAQMHRARALLESRLFLSRTPADDVIVTGALPTSMPGAGRYRFVATGDASGSSALVYAPVRRTLTIRMSAITGACVRAWWFNQRNGETAAIGTLPNTAERAFTPPDRGEMIDLVLVLDDASRSCPPPGS